MRLRRSFCSVLLVGALGPLALGDTIKHRSSGQEHSGKILQQERKDSRERILFQAQGGKTAWIWTDQWEVVDAARESRQPPNAEKADVQSETPEAEPADNVVEVNFADDNPPATDTGSLIRQVVATGVGLDPEKALQNAFSHAVEHAVGVLVDAETVVENDEIIRDRVLTFSRAYVQDFQVVRRWQDAGLHHARIKATVRTNKLVEKLKASNIAMRDVPGEMMYRQLKHDVTSEQDSAEMFANIMEDYTIDKLFRVEILGEPEVIEKTQVDAKLKISLRLTPDWEQWKKMHAKLHPLLQRVATKRSSFGTVPRNAAMDEDRWIALENDVAADMERRLQANGPAIALLKSSSRSGGVTLWDIYRIPDSSKTIADVLQRILAREHQVRVVLLDANQQPILEKQTRLLSGLHHNNGGIIGSHTTSNGLLHSGVPAYWLAPLFWHGRGCRFVYEPCEVTIRVELEKLSKVSKCAAYAEVFDK